MATKSTRNSGNSRLTVASRNKVHAKAVARMIANSATKQKKTILKSGLAEEDFAIPIQPVNSLSYSLILQN
ncbi:hypothetical protein FF1_022243 [Malus domestica]